MSTISTMASQVDLLPSDATGGISAIGSAAPVGDVGFRSSPAAGVPTLERVYRQVDRDRRYAPATRAMRALAWKHVPDRMREAPIDRIDAEMVDGVLSDVRAPAMRAKVRSVLSGLFTQAMAKNLVAWNPARRTGIRPTRAERTSVEHERRYLTAPEVDRLICETPERYRMLIRLMVHVGLRPGEAQALTLGQFDPRRATLNIDRSIGGPTKTGEARILPIPRVLADGLTDHIARFAGDDRPQGLVFRSPEGLPINSHNWRRRVFGPACSRAGISGLRVADLRHTAAAFAIQSGANVHDVQRLLGHTKPAITLNVYSYLWSGSLEALAARMDTAIKTTWPPASGGG